MKKRPRATARWSKLKAVCVSCGKKWKSERAAAEHAAKMGHFVAVEENRGAAYGPREVILNGIRGAQRDATHG